MAAVVAERGASFLLRPFFRPLLLRNNPAGLRHRRHIRAYHKARRGLALEAGEGA